MRGADDLGESDEDDFNTEEKTVQERDLEDLVFGSIESSILTNIDKLNKNKYKKIKQNVTIHKNDAKPEIADNLDQGRKAVWNDDADQEMYFFFSILIQKYFLTKKKNKKKNRVDLNQFDQFSNVINTNSDKVTTSQIEESLKARYTKYYGTPMWADLDLKKSQKLKKEEIFWPRKVVPRREQ